jgi:transposase
MTWKEFLGGGKALTARWAKPHSHEKPWGPTQRIGGKKGSKRHLLVDERGVPLSLVVTGANRHDVTQLEAVLDAIMIKRPKVTKKHPQHLCADNAYTGEPARQIMLARNYTPHVRPRAEEARAKKTVPGFRARRWVVEAGHSWFNRFRKVFPRYEKTLASHEALLHIAAAIICWRKIHVIYG